MSLVRVVSELLNKSSLDSISIWLFDQTIFFSVYVLYYGCISSLSFSKIRRKITYILPLEIGENCSKQPFYHVGVTSACYVIKKKLSWWFHTRTFNESAHEFWNFWWFHKQILKFLMIPHTNFGEWSRKFNIRFNCDFISLKQAISIWAWCKRWHP